MSDRAQLVVVGGGVAGASAAIEAARHGVRVTLIDENPVDPAMMGLDIPLYFGQRMLPTVRDKGSMLQRVVSSNGLLAMAQQNAVDVLLATYVWGSFRNQDNSHQLPSPVLGLADEEHSWTLEYDHLVLAPGARDLVLAFPGRHLAGVMGSCAVNSLITLYQALGARKMVILGSGELGLSTAIQAKGRGVEIVAIVEVSSSVQGSDEMRSRIEAEGIPIYTSQTVSEARGHREVESVVISRVNDEHRSVSGTQQELECDTVCLAIGQVPNVELPYVTGCRMSYRPELGGYVPERDERMRTSIENVYVVGDGGGLHDGSLTDSTGAAAQGKLAGIGVAEATGMLSGEEADALRQGLSPLQQAPDGGSTEEYRAAWMTSLVAAGGMEVNVCECEEVTRRELLDVAPPRFLGWSPGEKGHLGMTGLLQDGPINLDHVKRITRAGMGYCQGRRCREEITMLTAREAGLDVSQVPLASYRAPVRPLPLDVLWPEDEPEELRENWTAWFSRPWKNVAWRVGAGKKGYSPR